MLHTPGETSDQICVWIPDWKVAMPGDNIYKTFPNLYAVRGTPPRSCEDWYRSLDKVRRLKPHHLVPSHTEPISGEDNVYDIITHYRDAIQFINDQTIRHLNNGFTIDEIVQRVRLPQSLATHPYLLEHYGMAVWSVRSVIDGKIGWYDRDPVNLFPLTKQEEAQKLETILNKETNNGTGIVKMLDVAEEIANDIKATDDEIQWSLKLSMHAFRLTKPENPLHDRAVSVASKCFNSKAAAAWNPAARHINILSCKMLTDPNLLTKNLGVLRAAWIKKWPIEFSMEKLRYQFKAEACDELEVMTLIFAFPDVSQQHSYTMRHCVLEYCNNPEYFSKEYDTKVTCNSDIWKDIMANTKDLKSALNSEEVVVECGKEKLERFMDLIDVGKNIKESVVSR